MEQNYFQLNDGNRVPAVGLGTIGMQGARGVQELLAGIDNGYRYLDSSTNYHNEGAVGEAVRKTHVHRDELMVVSKLPGSKHDFDGALTIIQEQLYRMGLDYFDAYLIHWPLPKQDQYVEAWEALIQAQKLGLIRSIGVSNFLPEHLDRIIEATGVTPAINQSERHPYFINNEVIEADRKHGILTQAWSPLGRGYLNDVLENKTILEIGQKYGKSNAQVILRWNFQRGVMTIAKSGTPDHQRDNLNIFDFALTDDEMQTINQLDKGEAGRVEGQHPNEYEEFV